MDKFASMRDPEKWALAEQWGTPVNTMMRNLKELRKAALRCVELGEMTTDEYDRFCKKNGMETF